MKKVKVFLDSDGVFSDFLGGMKKFFNFEFPKGHLPEHEHKSQSEWVGFKIWSRPFFWVDLDLLPGAKELYEFFRPHKPTVLTAVPNNYVLDSVEAVTAGMEKKMWWRNHFGAAQADRLIWTLAKLKHKYCKAKEEPDTLYVLIDDHKTNIKEWEEAGGIGILHDPEHPEKTVEEFQRRVLSQLEPETVS
jgi:hypothetical protein